MSIRKNSKLIIYYSIVLFSMLCSFVSLYVNHGIDLDNLVFNRGGDHFMDFFNHISYVSLEGRAHVYDQGYNACFPPLAYLFYGFLAHLIPRGQTAMYNAFATGPYALLLYACYCVLLAVTYYIAIEKVIGKRTIAVLTTFTTIISNVFIFGVLERGNSAWLVCILLLFSVYLRESDSLYKKEFALILIAVAAAFKVYPALMGILYIVERRWKEAFRLLIYGVVCFFCPFALFGGVHGFRKFVDNQMVLQNTSDTFGNIYFISHLVKKGTSSASSIYIVFFLVFSFACVISIYSLKRQWIRVFIICSMMTLLPKWSANYTIIYFVVPLCLFFRETGKKRGDNLYAALFACIFSLITNTSHIVF